MSESEQEVTTFTISQTNYNQAANATGGVTIQIVYDDTPPSGYEIRAVAPDGTFTVICARPCDNFTLPG